MSENLLDVDLLCEQREKERRLTFPDPETDPVILALERDEAYELVRHHEELRALAERDEQHQIRRIRLITPKAIGFGVIEKALIRHVAGAAGNSRESDGELVEHLLTLCRQANAEVQKIVDEVNNDASEPESAEITEARQESRMFLRKQVPTVA